MALLFCAAVLLVFSFSSFAQTESPSGWIEDDSRADKTREGGKVTLKLGVKHTDHFPAIPNRLRTGSVFDETQLRRRHRALRWYPIPAWLAGRWKRDNECIVETEDYLTGYRSRASKSIVSKQVADFGFQKDREGTVWHCDILKHGLADRGSYRSVALVEIQKPIKTKDEDFIFKEVFIVLHVLKANNVISDSYRIESITRYHPLKPGLLNTRMSVKVYSENGSPQNRQENVSLDRRMAPFSPMDEYKGRNVRQDFIKYLKERSLSKLIPM